MLWIMGGLRVAVSNGRVQQAVAWGVVGTVVRLLFATMLEALGQGKQYHSEAVSVCERTTAEGLFLRKAGLSPYAGVWQRPAD